MAKRFTDTQIWEKNWFTKLSCKHKCLVRYLFDRCDNAGVWECNLALASACIGEKITEKDLEEIKHLIRKLSKDKYLIIDFIEFQYKVLNPNCKPHQRVLELLKKHNIPYPINKDTLPPTLPHRVQEEEEDQEEEKDQDQDQETNKGDYKGGFTNTDLSSHKEIIGYCNEKWKTKYKFDGKEVVELINARLEDGYTMQDFKQVVDNMTIKWKNDPKMSSYLCPQTLFQKTKFSKYLNMIITPFDTGQVSAVAQRNIEVGKSWLEKKKQEALNAKL